MSTMLQSRVNRDDVVRAYQLILKREPESEYAIQSHLKDTETVWDVVRNLLNSDEFTYLSSGKSHIAINKCFDGAYLSRNLPVSLRMECFLKTHQILYDRLNHDRIRSVYFGESVIWHGPQTCPELAAFLFTPLHTRAEGELCLTFRAGREPLYTISFSFVPGHIVGHDTDCAILISRMQGMPGRGEPLREAAKALENVNAQSVLFAALCGIGAAVGAGCLASVEATNQITFRPDLLDVFERNYDHFLSARGAEKAAPGYYVVALPLVQKPLGDIPAPHRPRTKRKRALKESIAKQAAQTFASWQRDDAFANGVQ